MVEFTEVQKFFQCWLWAIVSLPLVIALYLIHVKLANEIVLVNVIIEVLEKEYHEKFDLNTYFQDTWGQS